MAAIKLEPKSNRMMRVKTSMEQRPDPNAPGKSTWHRKQHELTAYNGYEAYIGTRSLDDPEDWVAGPLNDLEDVEFERLLATMARIPDEEIYPTFEGPLTVFDPATLADKDYFLKKPNIGVHKENTLVVKLALAEARTHEAFLQQPHPNLGTYLGCAVRGGRLVGLAFPKHVDTLADRVENAQKKGSGKFSVEQGQVCMDSIQSAARHLHSIGYAHNDISPCNIMFDRNNVPVLIDLDSCTPLGEKLTKAGVVGGWRGPWLSKEEFKESSVECDMLSIQFVRDWLVEELSSVEETR